MKYPLLLWLVFLCTAHAQTVYLGESAILSNGAQMRDRAYGSGGQCITDLGGDDAGCATFKAVHAARDGLYRLEIWYIADDQRALAITVNGDTRLELFCQRKGRPYAVSSNSVLIPLRAGDNVIAFDNPEEAGPDLDRIVLQTNALPSGSISGVVNDSFGLPLIDAKVSLEGAAGFRCAATTDLKGRYSFPFVPEGNYHLRASFGEDLFAPWDAHFSATNGSSARQDFIARVFGAAEVDVDAKPPTVMDLGPWQVIYDLSEGAANFYYHKAPILLDGISSVRVPETVSSLDYKTRKAKKHSFHDAIGSGTRWTVVSENGPEDQMTQTFTSYEGQEYIVVEVEVTRKKAMRSRYIAPLAGRCQQGLLPAGDLRALFVPFDNDKWIRYDAVPFGGDLVSYEVSALYENQSRQGLVVGSIEHDQWKTGVRSVTTGDGGARLEIFGGVTSEKTRDVLPHGEISGETIRSPKIFLGYFPDWRDGMDAYAEANAKLAHGRVWHGGTPFGWNSWGKLQMKLDYQKAVEASDFFARELQPHEFQDDGVVYIGLDSGWNNMSDAQLRSFVDHCRSNHQEAGIYFTPFAAWRPNPDDTIPGTAFVYKDIFLYANGVPERIATGTALDPTHPGTRKLIESKIRLFRQDGFKYIKADFMSHGALEADRHYDPNVTTGMEAYNEGLKFISETLGPDVFLNLSIAPLFPARYANSRRIACDAFGDIGKTEYTLNSLTYGWWLSKVYGFCDPDQMVFNDYSEPENRARVTSAAITGLMLAGDDFSADGGETGKRRARQFLTNPDVDALARNRKSFRPVEGDTGRRASRLFTWKDNGFVYLAAFNYGQSEENLSIAFNRIGIKSDDPVPAKELWSGATTHASDPIQIKLGPADAALYRFNVGPSAKKQK